MAQQNKHAVTRRKLLVTAGATGATALAGCPSSPPEQTPTAGSPSPTEPEPSDGSPPDTPQGRVEQLDAYPRVEVATVSELSTGDVERFAYPLQGQENFITKLGTDAWGGVGQDSDIVAFNAACTHAGCGIAGQVSPDDHMAGPCPCHFTTFDLTKSGIVVLGQATTDLPQIRLDVEDGSVYATGVDGLMWGYHNNLRNGTPVEGAQPDGDGSDDGTTPTQDAGQFGGWFDNVSNFDGVSDATGQSSVTVTVGAEGNNGNFAFGPAAVKVSSGTTVIWEWNGMGGQHNVVAENGDFESELTAEQGFTFEQIFETAGTYKYYCDPHRALGMKGVVIVE